jgi:catalase
VQIVEEKDEHKFDFDLLDATKLIPEELVPVRRIGKMTLNRNPDNFFAETEQVAFNPGHIVPGIDLTNDPLLQGRLFSYTDTQLIRLGGPNSHEIPINRTVAPVHNTQRDGHMRQTINIGRISYEPNSLGGNCPMQAKADMGGFVSLAAKMDGAKIRARSEKFFDHFSQAALFYRSQSEPEKAHLVNALRFELGKVETAAIRQRMVGMLAHVDRTLASRVAQGLGLPVPNKIEESLNLSIPADGNAKQFQSKPVSKSVQSSAALSMANTIKDGIKTRKIAILAADGFDAAGLSAMKKALEAAGAQAKIVAPRLGVLKSSQGTGIKIDFSLLTASSVLFDAVYIPGGDSSVKALTANSDAVQFINEAYKHCKAIAASGAAGEFVTASCPEANSNGKLKGAKQPPEAGVITGPDAQVGKIASAFIKAIGQHRHWSREMKDPGFE